MIERAVIQSGVRSVNINSTIGGKHVPTSRHYSKYGVDMDRVNGKRVNVPSNANAVLSLMQSVRAQPDADETYGPYMNKRRTVSGHPERLKDPYDVQSVGEDHIGHLHFSRIPKQDNSLILAPLN